MTGLKVKTSQAEYLKRTEYIINNKALSDSEKMIALLDYAAGVEIYETNPDSLQNLR